MNSIVGRLSPDQTSIQSILESREGNDGICLSLRSWNHTYLKFLSHTQNAITILSLRVCADLQVWLIMWIVDAKCNLSVLNEKLKFILR